MKSILIPTTLQLDALYSVKAAIKQTAGTNCIITLLMVHDAPDAESASYFLRKTRQSLTEAQIGVLQDCRDAITNTPNCRLEVHNQYGLSAPLLKNLMDHLEVNLIIIPASYKLEKSRINRNCLELLANSRMPILHMTGDCEEQEFSKALYVEQNPQLGVQELQQLISSQFSFKIVSHTALSTENTPHIQLTEAIEKNNIDLVIETRKPEKRKKSKNLVVNDTLGLPVLSIYEDAVL